ncbi:MAG: glucose-1-phosphate cytidylyltransferase [Anaerolineae bacterium]|nr:glucose-1-phosphate cytidylyltransferase [Phycisphaerae bacterium]
MKVVLFCGGQGMRLREYGDHVPKPMVPVGPRPILWHLMKYYAHYGHHDFVLCLGHQANVIKEYFLNYKESVSNDFVLSDGGRSVQLLNSDIDKWNITFCDTGMNANIGQRLMAVREHLDGEAVFMANYADNLTDLPLPTLMTHFRLQNKIATFLAVRPSQSFHVVQINDDQTVYDLTPTSETDIWINGGYFIFKQEIFDHMTEGEELVLAPFQRLMQKRQLTAFQHKGFWACMDTYKEKQMLDELHARGNAPWHVWNKRAMRAREMAGVVR